MDINEFINIMTRDLEQFREKWKQENKNNSDLWPDTMSKVDWWDQFDAFVYLNNELQRTN